MKIQYSSSPGTMVAAMEDESPDTHIFHGSDEKGLVTYDSCHTHIYTVLIPHASVNLLPWLA